MLTRHIIVTHVFTPLGVSSDVSSDLTDAVDSSWVGSSSIIITSDMLRFVLPNATQGAPVATQFKMRCETLPPTRDLELSCCYGSLGVYNSLYE